MPDLGGAVLDLAGGVYLLGAPVVLPAGGGANFAVLDGTLRAAASFPPDRFLLEGNATAFPSNYFEDATFSNILFDAAGRGGGLLLANTNHAVVDDVFFFRFATSGLTVLNGHEVYTSNSWFSQGDFPDCIGHIGVSLEICLTLSSVPVCSSPTNCNPLLAPP